MSGEHGPNEIIRSTAPDALRLRAEDADGLHTLSAVLQDSLIRTGDIAYFPEQQRFALVANRFRWEHAPEVVGNGDQPETAVDARFEDVAHAVYERVHSGLRIDGVRAVQRKNIDPRDKGRILNLMAITCEPIAGGQQITLEFSHQGVIRLEADRILCHLEDLDEPWPTTWRPHHAVEGNPAEEA